MDIDTLLAERDPARLRPLPGTDSAESIALYRTIVQPGSVAGTARGPHRRIMIGAVTGAAAASAIGLTLGLLPSGAQTASPRPAGSSSTAINTHLTAKQVLDKAAATALTEPTVVPRPDQFVYTKLQAGPGHVTQSWFSVDGSRNGLKKGYFEGGTGTTYFVGCVNGEHQIRLPGYNGKRYQGPPKPKHPVPLDGPVVTESCVPDPSFFPDMPSTASAMGAYLERAHGARPDDVADIAQYLEYDFLLPAQRAALYEFLATLPGITVQHNVKDAIGRPGIGVSWSRMGYPETIIFDPGTYAPLEIGGDAVIIQPTIVDQVGQVP